MTTWNEFSGDGLPPGCRAAEAQLANGLRVITIDAPSARQARLVLSVGAGYLDEPETHPGLAHLLEHALFLDSRHDCDTASFAGWVGKRGGRYNARTDDEVTDYHLTLPPTVTAEGLERLLALVASPRFEPAAIEREVNVIDAEFQARLADPALHRQAALSRFFPASHPARHCHAGNRATLGGDGVSLCQALSDFHGRYYRAGLMVLVILAPLSLAAQRALIEAAAMPLAAGGKPPRRTWRWANAKSTRKSETESESEPQGIRWVSPTGERSLELLWPVPPQATPAQQQSIERIAGALMNGELAATLAGRGWLDDLSAGTDADAACNALSLKLSLTEAGSENVTAILTTCQAAVAALARRARALPDPPIAELDRWPIEHARQLARDRFDAARGAPSSNQLARPELSALMAWLAPHRCRVLQAVESLAGESRRVPVTNTRYQPFAALPPEHITPLAPIRPPTLEARPLNATTPATPLRRYVCDNALTLWHGGGPPAIEASLCLGWPSDAAGQQRRLERWRRDSLALRQIAASQGVSLSLAGDGLGDGVSVHGRAELLESVAAQAIECWPREATDREPPASGLIAQRLLARLELPDTGSVSNEQLAPCCWIAGLDEDDTMAIAGRLNTALSRRMEGGGDTQSAASDTPAAGRVHRLPLQGGDYAVMLQVDARDASPLSRLYLQLLMHCHDAAFFQELRQRRGLGYVAAVRYRQAGGWPRLGYVVQSPHTATSVLQQAIRDFLSIQGSALARLDSATFEHRREALRSTCGEPETANEALHERWQALRLGDDTPPWRAAQDALARLYPQGLIEYAEALVSGELRWRWWMHDRR
nr:insulinase family protein [uncultured Halomonas sp.]